jgi:hypothetical protein
VAVPIPDATPLTSDDVVHHILGRSLAWSRPAEWCRSVRVRLCGSDHAVISSGVATPS